MLDFKCPGEPVACFAVISHYFSKLCALAITSACPLISIVKRRKKKICLLKSVL